MSVRKSSRSQKSVKQNLKYFKNLHILQWHFSYMEELLHNWKISAYTNKFLTKYILKCNFFSWFLNIFSLFSLKTDTKIVLCGTYKSPNSQRTLPIVPYKQNKRPKSPKFTLETSGVLQCKQTIWTYILVGLMLDPVCGLKGAHMAL